MTACNTTKQSVMIQVVYTCVSSRIGTLLTVDKPDKIADCSDEAKKEMPHFKGFEVRLRV